MTAMFNDFLFGGDWNPEQWPEDTWEHDVELLEQAYVNEATINVFSWALLEPSEGMYDFSMLDKIVALLNRHDFSIVMATGTAAVPAWMARDYPQVMRTGVDGTHQVFGGRHNFCPSSPQFRRFARALAAKVAERYADNPGVVAWHVNNEYGNGGGYCYCDTCAQAFHTWLERKYGSVEELNRAWCMNFWSHTIHDFNEVVPPVTYGDGIGTDKCVISGLQMDYRRFQNEQMLACYRLERDAIRMFDTAKPVTTNLMGTFKDLDYFAWGREMDVVSWDNYPGMDTQPSFTAMCHDLMRGVGGGKPFMLMEQTPNQQNWFPYCKVKRPGEVGKLSWQAVAHGADTVQFFQLKQSIGGCERFHGAVIGHDNSNRSRTYGEVATLGGDLAQRATQLMGSRIDAHVAVIFDWENYWSLEGCVGPTQGLHYPDEVHRFYRAFWKRNAAVDIVESTANLQTLSKYDIVVAPTLIMVKPGVAETLTQYVRGGGRLVTGYMSGIHNEFDLVIPGGYPGPLRELVGAWVEEIDAIAPHESIDVEIGETKTPSRGTIVASIIESEGARSLAVYGGSDFYAGTPAVIANAVGDGEVTFIGTALDDAGMSAIIDPIIDEAGIPVVESPDGVEVMRRVADDGTVFTIVTNTGETATQWVDERGVTHDLDAFAVLLFVDGVVVRGIAAE